jgi:hypothetical protein
VFLVRGGVWVSGWFVVGRGVWVRRGKERGRAGDGSSFIGGV